MTAERPLSSRDSQDIEWAIMKERISITEEFLSAKLGHPIRFHVENLFPERPQLELRSPESVRLEETFFLAWGIPPWLMSAEYNTWQWKIRWRLRWFTRKYRAVKRWFSHRADELAGP